MSSHKKHKPTTNTNTTTINSNNNNNTASNANATNNTNNNKDNTSTNVESTPNKALSTQDLPLFFSPEPNNNNSNNNNPTRPQTNSNNSNENTENNDNTSGNNNNNAIEDSNEPASTLSSNPVLPAQCRHTCDCIGVVQNRLFHTSKALYKHESNPHSHSRCTADCPAHDLLQTPIRCVHICCVFNGPTGPTRSQCATSLLKSVMTRHQSNATIHITCEPACPGYKFIHNQYMKHNKQPLVIPPINPNAIDSPPTKQQPLTLKPLTTPLLTNPLNNSINNSLTTPSTMFSTNSNANPTQFLQPATNFTQSIMNSVKKDHATEASTAANNSNTKTNNSTTNNNNNNTASTPNSSSNAISYKPYSASIPHINDLSNSSTIANNINPNNPINFSEDTLYCVHSCGCNYNQLNPDGFENQSRQKKHTANRYLHPTCSNMCAGYKTLLDPNLVECPHKCKNCGVRTKKKMLAHAISHRLHRYCTTECPMFWKLDMNQGVNPPISNNNINNNGIDNINNNDNNNNTINSKKNKMITPTGSQLIQQRELMDKSHEIIGIKRKTMMNDQTKITSLPDQINYSFNNLSHPIDLTELARIRALLYSSAVNTLTQFEANIANIENYTVFNEKNTGNIGTNRNNEILNKLLQEKQLKIAEKEKALNLIWDSNMKQYTQSVHNNTDNINNHSNLDNNNDDTNTINENSTNDNDTNMNNDNSNNSMDLSLDNVSDTITSELPVKKTSTKSKNKR